LLIEVLNLLEMLVGELEVLKFAFLNRKKPTNSKWVCRLQVI